MSAGNTELNIPALPSKAGMRDCCLVSLFSLGEATKYEVFTFRNIQQYI